MRNSFPFALWFGSGFFSALSVASGFTIGIFIAPIALLLLVVCATVFKSRGVAGLPAGIGILALLLAFLNRRGPGEYCSAPQSCGYYFDPSPFLLLGVAAIILSVFIQSTLSHHKPSRSR